jgi:hypothetical protein
MFGNQFRMPEHRGKNGMEHGAAGGDRDWAASAQ